VKYVQPTLISLLAVFTPIKAMLLVTLFLIFSDLVSGIVAAKKRGEDITSAGFRRTLTKLFVYNLAIITGFLVESYMVSGLLPISKLIAGVVSLVETKSILENLNSINGTDIFKTVLNSLESKNNQSERTK
jgi:phage-related holin